MNCVVEKNEKNVALVKLEISKENFEKGIEAAYQKNKSKFVADGFRKGKVPRAIVERKYGKNIFYEDAIDEAFPESYSECVESNGFHPCASPRLISVDEVGEDGAKLTIEISLYPAFELGEYKNIKIEPLEYTVTEDDIEEEIKKMQDKNSRLVSVDEASADGDTITIDFEGFLDDVPFEGGKAESYPLVLGSGTFIPGFEEQLIGKKNGEELNVKVTFPENYQAENLAGKDAVFKVKVHDVKRKEFPEVDDEFAKDLGFDDLAALKEDIVAGVKATKEDELEKSAERKIIGEIIENSPMEIPPQMLAERAENTKQNYEMRLKNSGIDPEMYYQYMMQMSGSEDGNYVANMFSQEALREIQTELILEKIIEKEQIDASEEELDKEYEKYAETEGQSLEEFKETLNDYSISFIKNIIVQHKAYDFLLEQADQTPAE